MVLPSFDHTHQEQDQQRDRQPEFDRGRAGAAVIIIQSARGRIPHAAMRPIALFALSGRGSAMAGSFDKLGGEPPIGDMPVLAQLF